ncbi:MAG: MmcQ/YjbR family DNA-binding protein [Prevotella sp.]|nr:MmcQ/YjbR family DNA-binding protein [Prevotella sp.]
MDILIDPLFTIFDVQGISYIYMSRIDRIVKMNIEDYREFCLSLGNDVEEKLPFTAFRYAGGVLAFYVHGHMFSFFDCDTFSVITVKCQPNRIDELRASYDCIVKPFNLSPKYWIGIQPDTTPDDLLMELTRNSYEIVKAKYRPKD